MWLIGLAYNCCMSTSIHETVVLSEVIDYRGTIKEVYPVESSVRMLSLLVVLVQQL